MTRPLAQIAQLPAHPVGLPRALDDHPQLLEVDPGAYAEDYVEVSGDELREGMKVVTAG